MTSMIDSRDNNPNQSVKPVGDNKDDRFLNTEHLRKDLKGQAVRGGSLSLLSQASRYIINLGGTMILARVLTPMDFGLVAMVVSVTGILYVVNDLGLTDATVQKRDISHQQVSSLFWLNLTFSLLSALVAFASAPLLVKIFREPRLLHLTIFSSLSFIFTGVSVQHMAILKRTMLYKRITFIEITAALTSTVLAIIAALNGLGYWSLMIRVVTLAMAMSICTWFMCRWRPAWGIRWSEIKPMISFGANVTGYNLLNYLTRWLDKILIGLRYSASDLGFYNRAYQLFALTAGQLTVPLHSVAVATLSQLQNEPEKYRRFYLNAISGMSFVMIPITGVLLLSSADIIFLLFGPQWGKTAPLFSILALRLAFQFVYSSQAWLHVSLGRTDRWLRWGVIASFVTVSFIFLGLPFGPSGVATAYTLALYVLLFPAIEYAGKPIGINFMAVFAVTWRFTLAGLSAYVLSSFLLLPMAENWHSFLRILLAIPGFLIFYFMFVIIVYRGFSPIHQFLSLFRMVLKRGKKD